MNKASVKINYPVGVQNFTKLREKGYLYVDKTALLFDLVENGGYFFLSRPRRFGKSLMISTLEAYYQGRRDLFKGLALEFLMEDWETHPVLHLDLSNGQYTNSSELIEVLDYFLKGWEQEFGVTEKERGALPPNLRFNQVIRKAFQSTGKKVAILVDEYDKPMLGAVNNEGLAEEFRSVLKAFYSNLKSMDQYIEIGVLTGVARFSKVSIFSDLNNLRDITFEDRFAGICGVTSDELDQYFSIGMAELAEKNGCSKEEIRRQLKQSYDGYHFSKESPDIYNPYSLMSSFAKMELGPYWAQSGTPEYLVRILDNGDWALQDIAPSEVDADYLQVAGLLTDEPIPALYQTGYLTIKEYHKEFNTFLLDYPNEEVRNGFAQSLVSYFIGRQGKGGRFSVPKFVSAATTGDIDGFMRLMETMVAGVPYSEKGSAEAHFQNACYLLFTLMGHFVKVEDRTSDGRIDLTVETPGYIYIFEFKTDSSAEEAMDQIKRKQYWLKYRDCGKKVVLIGADFNTHTRRLSGYVIDTVG